MANDEKRTDIVPASDTALDENTITLILNAIAAVLRALFIFIK